MFVEIRMRARFGDVFHKRYLLVPCDRAAQDSIDQYSEIK